MDPPTILALKQAFLERATRQLAQPFAPSPAWRKKNNLRSSSRRSGAASPNGRLPPHAVDDALVRANQILQQHVRRVYAPLAVRHVAEQLDQLYRDADDQLFERPARADGSGDNPLDQGADYTTQDAVSSLPATWDDAREADALPLEARRYEELLETLQDLTARRTEAAARVRRLRDMVALLGGLGDTSTAQDSIVTRDGPVERELERMRVLLARVGDRVANLPAQATQTRDAVGVDTDNVEDVEAAGQQRVQALLGRY